MCLLYQQSLLKRRHQRVRRLEESVIVYTVTLIMMIQHGCMVMSLWAPGDEYMPSLPGMDELAPLTGKLS